MLGYQRGISLREIKAIRAVRRGRNPGSRRGNISIRRRHPPRRRGNQYAAASRFNHWRLWNTGSPKHPKPSLRAKRSNPFFCAARWIAFVASLLAMTVDMVSHSRGATRPSFAGNFRVPPIRATVLGVARRSAGLKAGAGAPPPAAADGLDPVRSPFCLLCKRSVWGRARWTYSLRSASNDWDPISVVARSSC
jgi:hypothetical protein